ncbi:hypothetical protein QFZ63_004275 [Streptomyces sp. B3I7]|nr:hypothetical protein [Streptomyces sp. B3I7]
MPIASSRPPSGASVRRTRRCSAVSALMPKPMPVNTVNRGCAKGDITTRTKNVAAVTEAMPPCPPLDWSVPKAVPRYRMFSVKAKPVAVTPAVTTPSTMPVK